MFKWNFVLEYIIKGMLQAIGALIVYGVAILILLKQRRQDGSNSIFENAIDTKYAVLSR